MHPIARRFLLLALALPLLSGCVVYEEHVVLDDKGGAVVDIRFPSEAAARITPEAADPNVLKMILARSRPADVSVSVEKSGNDLHVALNAKKTSDLLEWARNEQNPLGEATAQSADGYLDVMRTVSLPGEFNAKALGAAAGMKMVFKLTAPGTLVSSNATRVDGSTAIWEVDPAEIVSPNKKIFTARYRVSTPWFTYTLIALMVLAVGAFFVVLRRKGA